MTMVMMMMMTLNLCSFCRDFSYMHQPDEDFLVGLARGVTRSALAAELAEAALAGNAPGVLEARLWECREVCFQYIQYRFRI